MQKLFYYIFPITFFLLGIFLRLKGLEQQSLWFDELFSILNSSYDSLQSVLNRYLSETNPPFYAILLFYWIHFFGSEVQTVRLASASFGILSLCILLYFYFRPKILNAKVNLFSLLFFSTCLGGIYFAQEARSYSLMIFLSLILTYQSLAVFTILIDKKNISNINLSFFALISIILSYTHYFGFLLVAIVWTLLFLYSLRLRFWKNMFTILSFGSIVLIAYSYEIIKLINLKAESIAWIPEPNLLIYLEFINYVFFFLKGKYTLPLFLTLIIILAISIWKGKFNKYTKQEIQISFFLMYTVVILIISTYIVSQFKPIVTARNLLILIFPIYILIGIFFSKFKFPISSLINVWLAIISINLLLSYYKDYQRIHKSDFRQLAMYTLTPENITLPVYSPDHPEYYNYYLLNYNKRTTLVQPLPDVINTKNLPREFIILEADLLKQLNENQIQELKKIYHMEQEVYFKARSYRMKLSEP